MLWIIDYCAPQDYLTIWHGALGNKKHELRVAAGGDLGQMRRYALRIDPKPTFELRDYAERFRARIGTERVG